MNEDIEKIMGKVAYELVEKQVLRVIIDENSTSIAFTDEFSDRIKSYIASGKDVEESVAISLFEHYGSDITKEKFSIDMLLLTSMMRAYSDMYRDMDR